MISVKEQTFFHLILSTICLNSLCNRQIKLDIFLPFFLSLFQSFFSCFYDILKLSNIIWKDFLSFFSFFLSFHFNLSTCRDHSYRYIAKHINHIQYYCTRCNWYAYTHIVFTIHTHKHLSTESNLNLLFHLDYQHPSIMRKSC